MKWIIIGKIVLYNIFLIHGFRNIINTIKFSLKIFFFNWYLFERQTERMRDLPSAGSLSKWLHWPGLGQRQESGPPSASPMLLAWAQAPGPSPAVLLDAFT